MLRGSLYQLIVSVGVSMCVLIFTLPHNCHSCGTSQFQCSITKACVPTSFRCDGDPDCGDGDTSDELNCGLNELLSPRQKLSVRLILLQNGTHIVSVVSSCSANQIRCNTTRKCINFRHQCNNDNDCGDSSDEVNCDPCPPWRFQCRNSKRCISIASRCDGENDCGDSSDEANCINYTRTCLMDEIRCNTTNKCISINYKCDGDNDCGDLSDELNCGNRTVQCPSNKFRCPSLNKCVSHGFKCDGDNDCGDLSDEANCGNQTTCAQGRFKCDNGYCLNRKYACNGKNDCLDESDERGCIRKEPCETKEFRCRNGKCIQNSALCNGDVDCNDGSDELYCTNKTCSGFWCNSRCLSNSKVCNLKYDCEDLSDETSCPAALDLSVNAKRIIGLITKTATWTLNITSNTKNWTVFLKNPKEKEIDFNSTKYQVSVEQIAPLIFELKIEVHLISWEDMGYYPLQIKIDGTHHENNTVYLYLTVQDHRPPEFIYTNLLNSSLQLTLGKPLELICNFTGRPRTKIVWSRDNESLSSWPPEVSCTMYQDNQVLLLQSVPKGSPGRFMCTGENANGSISGYVDIKVHHEVDQLQLISVILGSIFCLIVLVLGALVARYHWKQKKLKRMLSGLSEKEFYQGAIENLNPNLSVSDQAHLLPFQQATWELPRESIKLGIPLGSGAFGLVLQAAVKGIVEGEDSSTVAVKTVKPNADESHFKALITELKIMANLGKHLNVVNLIGACTKNLVKKRELLVVMEFCKYGCLLNYLLEKRSSFINQLDPKTDKNEPETRRKNLNRKKTVFRESTKRNSKSIISGKREECEEFVEIQYVKTIDLLIWAFQVAMGMQYLSSKKVFHGDLAARNVLLTENKIAKICDFGYARETYKNYDYKKNIRGVLLPVKWMAIESIYCGVFSSKSDCWSYGVLLWEMFTLGNKPYPGMEVNEDFCQKLHDGYRLEKPQYAPNSVYKIMMDAWKHEPSERPSFMQIANRLREIISEWDASDYLKMAEMYANVPDGDFGSVSSMKMEETDIYVNTKGGSSTASKRYQEIPTA